MKTAIFKNLKLFIKEPLQVESMCVFWVGEESRAVIIWRYFTQKNAEVLLQPKNPEFTLRLERTLQDSQGHGRRLELHHEVFQLQVLGGSF